MKSTCSRPLFISGNQPLSYYFDYVILRNFTKIPRERVSTDLVAAKKYISVESETELKERDICENRIPFAGRSQQEKESRRRSNPGWIVANPSDFTRYEDCTWASFADTFQS